MPSSQPACASSASSLSLVPVLTAMRPHGCEKSAIGAAVRSCPRHWRLPPPKPVRPERENSAAEQHALAARQASFHGEDEIILTFTWAALSRHPGLRHRIGCPDGRSSPAMERWKRIFPCASTSQPTRHEFAPLLTNTYAGRRDGHRTSGDESASSATRNNTPRAISLAWPSRPTGMRATSWPALPPAPPRPCRCRCSRADGVDGDAALALPDQRLGEAMDARLARHSSLGHTGRLAVDRADIDDAANLRSSMPSTRLAHIVAAARLVSSTSSQAWRFIFFMVASRVMPALLTITSPTSSASTFLIPAAQSSRTTRPI